MRWAGDPLWGHVYDWSVEHRRIGGALWALTVQSDLGLLYQAAAEIGRQRPGALILDVPVGGGVAARALRPDQDATYVGADISPAMLRRTAARGVPVTPVLADVGQLGFADDTFDLVASFMGLHCFPDPVAAVAELCRVTRLGGVVTGSTILEDSGLRYLGLRVSGKVAGLLGPGITSSQLRRSLSRGGVADVQVTVSGPVAYFRGIRRA